MRLKILNFSQRGQTSESKGRENYEGKSNIKIKEVTVCELMGIVANISVPR